MTYQERKRLRQLVDLKKRERLTEARGRDLNQPHYDSPPPGRPRKVKP
jgi:hypothetical protein